MTITAAPYKNVFELARAFPLAHSPVFNRLFDLNVGHPRCVGTKQLTEKYGVQQDNVQTVISVTNRVTLTQAWFNEARTQKPQTFTWEPAVADPTEGGRNCDFCDWRHYTAEDTFGRIEATHAVSASNLFKYCHPHQGVILFKHHNPLEFNLEQLSDLVNVSHGWFQAAAAAAAAVEAGTGSSQGPEPPTNGSQPQPPSTRRQQQQQGAAAGQAVRQGGAQLHPLFIWNALPRAGASQFHGHAQVMLSSSPFPHLQQAQEEIACYNAVHPGASYYQDVLTAYEAVGLLRQAGSEGDRAFCYPSLSPTKDMEIFVQGSHMRSPAFQLLFYAALRTLIDELGVRTFNAAIYNIPLLEGQASSSSGEAAVEPVIARVVSRGKLSNQASDFGGLEVFGGASIGHTDTFAVAAALDAVLGGLQ